MLELTIFPYVSNNSVFIGYHEKKMLYNNPHINTLWGGEDIFVYNIAKRTKTQRDVSSIYKIE